MGAFFSLVFPIYNKNHSVKTYYYLFGRGGPMTPSLPPYTSGDIWVNFFHLFFPFATKSVIGIYKKLGVPHPRLARIPVSPDFPSRPTPRLARLPVSPESPKRNWPRKCPKKEVSKNLKVTVQILDPLDSAVSPSRHAVSPSRLAVSSRCLAVSPSRQRNDLDISKFWVFRL